MRELILDAAKWRSEDDVYDAFFRAVGAPDWHGRNFNALRDSIQRGHINEIEVPYRLIIRNFGTVGADARKMVGYFVDFIREIGAEGCPVEVRVDSGSEAA